MSNEDVQRERRVDLAVLGAGAAGLFAAIWAGRTAQASGNASGSKRGLSIVAIDSAQRLGAKILVAGGGRCNVTHHAVSEQAYAGSSRNAIKQVLRAFDVERTKAFFAELGVTLKREATGKLFPTTDDAHTVLDALLDAAAKAGVELIHPWRITDVFAKPEDGGVAIVGAVGRIWARRVILCTGGMALPRSGSDGAGYAFARAFGHGLTDHITPALVPLIVDPQHFVRSLSGLTVMAELSVQSGTGKRLESFTNSTLCTHFGLSGPGPLDVSRYYFAHRREDGQTVLVINWTPSMSVDQVDELLLRSKSLSPMRVLTGAPCELPERLARAICENVGVDGSAKMDQMTKQSRRGLAQGCAAMKLPITGDRGFTFAEVTAGGVPLNEIELATMRSKKDPRAYLAGEICDVDGRIGGFNFQWAWASGFVAGCAAAKDLLAEQEN